MSNPLPTSGFNLERLYCSETKLRLVAVNDQSLQEEPEASFGWDWRILEPNVFEVLLQIAIGPSRARSEEISATLRGVFRVMGPSTSVAVRDFARLNAPAILMPFMREAVSTLTTKSYFGQYLLPPINVQVLMRSANFETATAERQLADPAGARLLPSSPASEVGA